jgi:hypothetical protein
MEKFKFDVVSQTLTISAKFNERMANPMSEEYKLVMQFRADFPNLTIVRKTHKTPSHYTTKSGEKINCNQFKNLTYDRMEKFIAALPQNKEYMREYTVVKNFGTSVNGNGYPIVREWFMAQFPEFRKNPLFYLSNTPQIIKATTFMAEQADDQKAA